MQKEPLTLPSFLEARQIVEKHAASLVSRSPEFQVEDTDLVQATHRILAENLVADRDLPPFSRSTRDGFAVRAVDAAGGSASLKLVGEIRAGQTGVIPAVGPGECVEIMTGAPLPTGADAVLMLEYAERDKDRITVKKAVRAGENFVPAAAEARAGQLLLQEQTRLTPAAIAIAASVGRAEVSVFRRPKVAVLATGDELVDVTAQPGPTQIRNSNSYSLAAQVTIAGGEPWILPAAPDRHDLLQNSIEQGLTADLLLITGGVSVGKYDLVKELLSELGAEFFLRGSAIQPGKPIVFGRTSTAAGQRYFFGLPGNPVSTMVTFELFVRPMLDALSGAKSQPLFFGKARLKAEFRTSAGLTRFLPARLSGEFGDVEVELVRWQGSGDIAATSLADCLLVVPSDREALSAGEAVNVLPLVR